MLTLNEKDFLLDGAPLRILSGALHYFRVLPEQWEDRLRKLRAMGLNTVETYVAWNLHEARPGEFSFDGSLDLVAFCRLAQRLGLHVILRPGPYICAEWEFGGLPAWLLKDADMVLRSSYRPYLDAVERFFTALLPRLLPLEHERGGPVIAWQVENEYGSYGSDKAYLGWLEALMRKLGLTGLFFTSDGPTAHMLTHGTLPHLLKTGNFGSRAVSELATLREYQPLGPLMCMEYWNGWFDHWGEPHHTRDAADAAACLDDILGAGASVNIFMFHGGTSFGYMNGANTDPETHRYQPTVNSYDYDAPLSEDGLPTEKFWRMREVIARHVPLPPLELPEPAPRFAHEALPLRPRAALFDEGWLSAQPRHRDQATRSMEALGQDYGYLLYRSDMEHPAGPVCLSAQDVHDLALVYLDGRYMGQLVRDEQTRLMLDWPGGRARLELLLVNLGRVNYGPQLHDRKGLLGWVRLGVNLIQDWLHVSLPLAEPPPDLPRASSGSGDSPCFYEARFDAPQAGDCFVEIEQGRMGQVWLNGFHLGRFWSRGPQRALYLPWPLLRAQGNELVVLELLPQRESPPRVLFHPHVPAQEGARHATVPH